jgi:hypothetical protein
MNHDGAEDEPPASFPMKAVTAVEVLDSKAGIRAGNDGETTFCLDLNRGERILFRIANFPIANRARTLNCPAV